MNIITDVNDRSLSVAEKVERWAELKRQADELVEQGEIIAHELEMAAIAYDKRTLPLSTEMCCTAAQFVYTGLNASGTLGFRVDCTWCGRGSGHINVPLAYVQQRRTDVAGGR